MPITDHLQWNRVFVQSIRANWLDKGGVALQVLRLDQLHPVISGNKWFKLQHYVAEAIQYNARSIATFGGAFSNHLVATAFACRQQGLPSLGIVRGEQPALLSHTLQQAGSYGMQLHFTSRGQYREKEMLKKQFPGQYWIEEGGYGLQGAAGAAALLQLVPEAATYTHLIAAAGTGTMLAGLIRAARPHQLVTGISVLKNHTGLEAAIRNLLTGQAQALWNICHQHHFGGYAKHPALLLQYMRDCWSSYQLPLDMVYTAKAFYATEQLVKEQMIPRGSNVLFIHSGGLQGNLSLPPGSLPF